VQTLSSTRVRGMTGVARLEGVFRERQSLGTPGGMLLERDMRKSHTLHPNLTQPKQAPRRPGRRSRRRRPVAACHLLKFVPVDFLALLNRPQTASCHASC
jgi:hypothetical protein